MCNFPSWIEDKDGNCFWNTDSILEEHGIDYKDGVGHEAIEKTWGITGAHKEGPGDYPIPDEFCTDIRRGKCAKMIKAFGAKQVKIKNRQVVFIELANGDREWYLNGKYHREDGPAVEYANGNRCWYLNGKYHREDGPAVEYANGDRFWYLNGKLHREDGPAIERANGDRYWYLNGVAYTEEEFEKRQNAN